MDKITVAIVGSRKWTDTDAIYNIVKHWNPKRVRIISGGANGADTIARQVANQCGIEFTEFPADWKSYGNQAGMIRNGVMVAQAQVVYAFVIDDSAGTMNTVNRAMKARNIKRVYVEKRYSEDSTE